MTCYNCSTEFGLLKKEVGCESCGFSFCSKCCKKQQYQTVHNEIKKMTVCNPCYKKLTSDDLSAATKYSPPLAHKKRMEALKKKSMSVDSGSHVHSEWSNEVDKSLAERLQKLKRDRIKAHTPTEEEIKVRLAKLKGIDPAVYSAPPIQVFRPTEKLTSDQQANKLIQQFTEEVKLDAKISKPEEEISERLQKLRDQLTPCENQETLPSLANVSSEKSEDLQSVMEQESSHATQIAAKELKILNTDQDIKKLLSNKGTQKERESEDDVDDEEAEKLVKKLLETGFSDEVDELEELNDLHSEEPHVGEDEELPWCIICNDDAKIKCFGCDGDLYCNNCFRECHDSLDIKDHKTCPFLPPKVPAL